MTYEKDIPDYALVPAREPEERVLIPITQGAVYSPVQVTNITEKPKTTIIIEEDILVPDTKPDLREILMIDGKVRLSSREIDQISKGEDYISISGDVELTTLYLPERTDQCGAMVSVPSRVPFKEQWHMGLTPGATVILDGKIEKIDYMVINERKYRVKVSLCVFAREYMDSKIDVFEGLTDEEIQTLREKIEITNIAQRKKDVLSLKEDMEIPDDRMVEAILKQDIHVVENYRQTTAEKAVINGFVYVNLLYSVVCSGNSGSGGNSGSLGGSSGPVGSRLVSGAEEGLRLGEISGAGAGVGMTSAEIYGDGGASGFTGSSGNDSSEREASSFGTSLGAGHGAADGAGMEVSDCICQLQERIEFTQFIPLSQGGQWSGSNVCFDENDLKVKLTQNEDGAEVFRLEGDIVTWLELYRNTEKELIVDGYHREKEFICDFEETSCRTLVGQAAGESTVREIISLESPYGDVERVLYAAGEIMSSASRAEAGKVITEGLLCGKLVCLGAGESAGRIFATRHEVPFRCVTAASQMTGNETVNDRIYMKDLWAEKINGKQVELNATVLVTSEIMRQAPFKVLKNPAFEEVSGSTESKPMVVYIVKQGDDLWSISKKFKTTRSIVSQLNQLEDERIAVGQKLLILK